MTAPLVSTGPTAWSSATERAADRPPMVESGHRRLRLRGGFLLFFGIAAIALLAALIGKSQGELLVAVAFVIVMIGDLFGAYSAFGDPVATIEFAGDAEVDVDTGATVTVRGNRQPLWVRVGWWQPRWFTLAAGVPGWAGLRPLARGSIRWIDIDLVARGPPGLWEVGRRDRVHVPLPVHVAPRAVEHQVTFPRNLHTRPFGESLLTRGADDLTRGVREYRPGDPRKLVHWPATAHHGQMLVRETETLGTVRLRIVVVTRSSGPATEVALGRAAWLVRDCLARGWEVELLTTERMQPLVPPALGRSPRTLEPGCSLVQEGLVNRGLIWSPTWSGAPIAPAAPWFGPPGAAPPVAGQVGGLPLVAVRTRVGDIRSAGDLAARLALVAPGRPEIPNGRIATRVISEESDVWR